MNRLHRTRVRWAAAAALALALASACPSVARAPGPEAARFSHARWDRLLRAYVSKAGWVAYERLRRESEGELDRYLEELARADLAEFGDFERKAFWINAYNALCIRTLLDEDLPESVPHRSFLGLGTNIFTQEDYTIAGKERSLDDIEHRILRKEFRDPRVHAALVCGASSCPRLRPEAYRAERLDAQLDEECRSWINEETDRKGMRKNRLDRARKTFYASKIFDWFDEDFGGSDEGILRFIRSYAEPSLKSFLETNEVRLRFLDYDWSLNRADEKREGREGK